MRTRNYSWGWNDFLWVERKKFFVLSDFMYAECYLTLSTKKFLLFISTSRDSRSIFFWKFLLFQIWTLSCFFLYFWSMPRSSRVWQSDDELKLKFKILLSVKWKLIKCCKKFKNIIYEAQTFFGYHMEFFSQL